MKLVELYGRVRFAVRIEGISRREAARRFGIDPRTVAKMLSFSVPPGYRRSRPASRPKLDPFVGVIERILDEDKVRPAKPRHTPKRIFERLRDEHGYGGGVTIVKDYVLLQRQPSALVALNRERAAALPVVAEKVREAVAAARWMDERYEPAIAAVPADQLPALIADRVRAEAAAGRFSGAVLVARGDELIFADAVGLADRSSGRANTLDTPINLGSINKMFTGIAIAQLQAAGKLDWQDTVGQHLPEFPNAKVRDNVTIHQLLTHTSGVGSYWNQAHAARKHELDSQQDFLETFVNQPLLFEPGQGLE